MLQAVYFLSDEYFDDIYGPEERADIAESARIVAPRFTVESYGSSGEAWPGVEAIFSGWGMVRMDEEFLCRFPDLRMVFYGAGSIRNLVTPAFWSSGVRITSAYAANAEPVSEFTVSQIIYALKLGWPQALMIKKLRRYPDRARPPGVYGSTVGLLSLGMIGRAVAKRLQEYAVKVIAHDPYVSSGEAQKRGVTLVSLDELFASSDVVSCHTPWLPETERMIQGKHFASMKPGATFLNTSRGAVVHEGEMIEVLRNRPDLTAVLDVTYPEPPMEGSSLYTLDNVVLTPHIAGSLARECRRMGRVMVDEMTCFLASKPLRYEIQEAQAAILA